MSHKHRSKNMLANQQLRSMNSGPSPTESLNMGLAELSALARHAFETKDRKQCLALTGVMLKMDPQNKEAEVIRNWVIADLRQDLETARELLREAEKTKSPATFDRAATTLQAILDAEPDNTEARALLAEASSNLPPHIPQFVRTGPPPAFEDSAAFPGYDAPLFPGPAPPVGIEALEARIRTARRPWRFATATLVVLALGGAGVFGFQNGWFSEIVGVIGSENSTLGILEIAMEDGVEVFVDGESRGKMPIAPLQLEAGLHELRYVRDGVEVGREQIRVLRGATVRNSIQSLTSRLLFFVVPDKGVQVTLDGKDLGAVPESLDVKPGKHELRFTAPGYEPETTTVEVAPGQSELITAYLFPSDAQGASTSASTGRGRGDSSSAASDSRGGRGASQGAGQSAGQRAGQGTGVLSVTSPEPVQVYIRDRFVGTTPLSLGLPAGVHTLDFRLGDRQRAASYLIKSGETRNVTVVFDVRLRIQARPWAQVFVEQPGGQVESLGQTPLSNVDLPIGAALLFRHPEHMEKRVRVTGDETVISVEFP